MAAPLAMPPDHSTSRMASVVVPLARVLAGPVSGTRIRFTLSVGRPKSWRKDATSLAAMADSPTMPMVTPVPSRLTPPMPGL